MTGKTAAILVHYGDVGTTARCLDGLAEQGPNLSVIVSNNGPREAAEALFRHAETLWPDDAVRLIMPGGPKQESPSPVTLVHNGENRGFAAGCNAGIRLALARKDARHVWLINNDARPDPGALTALVREAESHPRHLLGATVLAGNGDRLQLAGGAAYYPATTRMVPQHAGATWTDVPGLAEPRLDYVYGASLFAPVTLYREVGLLDETFFLFCEELDLCARARKAGYELGWCRGCVVHHAVSAAIGQPGQATPEQARLAAFHEARSVILFTRKHHPRLLPFALAARTMGKLTALLARGKWECMGPSLSGLASGLRPQPPAR